LGRGFACRRRRESALAPQAFLCVPAGHSGGPQTALSCLGCGFFDPQGFTPTAVEPPTPLGRPPSGTQRRPPVRPAGGQHPAASTATTPVPRGNSCLTTPIHGYINLFNPSTTFFHLTKDGYWGLVVGGRRYKLRQPQSIIVVGLYGPSSLNPQQRSVLRHG
jgi:hypothetical protein